MLNCNFQHNKLLKKHFVYTLYRVKTGKLQLLNLLYSYRTDFVPSVGINLNFIAGQIQSHPGSEEHCRMASIFFFSP